MLPGTLPGTQNRNNRGMKMWKFTFNGIQGFAERYNETDGVYVRWYGMGFHLIAANADLKEAILSQEK